MPPYGILDTFILTTVAINKTIFPIKVYKFKPSYKILTVLVFMIE